MALLLPKARGTAGFQGTWLHEQLCGSRRGENSVPYPARAYGETLAEFVFGARCLRTLIRCRQFLAEQLPAEDLTFEIPIAKRWDAAERADWTLAEGVSNGLRGFSPQVRLGGGGSGTTTGRQEMFDRSFGLYPILCLELFNHIVGDANYRYCANETCPHGSRPFVLQEGRAMFRQHRRDAIYCSRTCGNAQAKRMSRRRAGDTESAP